MKIVKTAEEVRQQVKSWKKADFSVGLVPTMGYLHEGHKSLIERAVTENDRVVVSDFVNPTQFREGEDFDIYPRDIDRDSSVCEEAGADLIFYPEASEMYAEGSCTSVKMTGAITEALCGITRPQQFGGVCTVVSKLFNIVSPDRAYFGQKDAQQLAVIRRMVKDLCFDIEIIGCPIIREADGLAKSSRNTYLSDEERKAALVLNGAIRIGLGLIEEGERNAGKVVAAMKEYIDREPLARIDYVEAVDADSIEPVTEIKDNVLVAMAVYIGKTRLIDNFIVGTHVDNRL